MNALVRKAVSKTIEQFAGSGVGVDDTGRLCLPDGLDADRAHRFIEVVLAKRFEHPKAALHALFERLGVDRPVVAALNDILGDRGEVDFRAIGGNVLRLGRVVPGMLAIPNRIQRFLVEDLALCDSSARTLEEAVVSTREQAAARLGCRADWDEILSRPSEVGELSRSWRERGD